LARTTTPRRRVAASSSKRVRPVAARPAEVEWEADVEEVAEDQKAIADAIVNAEKAAGRDNRVFVDALNASYGAFRAGKALAAGRVAVVAAGTPPRGSEIFKDPRYLKNARELAKRTLGGDRVIGGVPVKSPHFLDCVAVGNDAQWGCSGTLIGPNVVVTAGHCVDFATRVFFGYDISKAGKQVRVKKRVRHPEYRKTKHNDLMVLVLEEDVTTVDPRPLATKVQTDGAGDGRIVGFGNVDPAGVFGYGIKRMVDVPIASSSCSGKVDGQSDPMSYGCDRNLELVAGRPLLERDSCKGDSGGPFYVLGPDGGWFLAAATSRATDSAMHTCGDGGIYVRLDRYRSWIAQIPGAKLL
jgi:hypothetical protein